MAATGHPLQYVPYALMMTRPDPLTLVEADEPVVVSTTSWLDGGIGAPVAGRLKPPEITNWVAPALAVPDAKVGRLIDATSVRTTNRILVRIDLLSDDALF